MNAERNIDIKTQIAFVEAKPYSYNTSPLNLIDKIFDDPKFGDIKIIATKLLAYSIDDKMLSKEITIGAEAYENKNACTSRLLREVELGVMDNLHWSMFQSLLLKIDKPQITLLSLNRLGIIDSNIDQWSLLRLIEEHYSEKN